ncbi:hypothetical protein ACLBWH_01705 [Sphingomonas sp. M6A6_1c]
MKTTIGKHDPETRQVPVVFDPDGVAHRRAVNACYTEDGSYDRKATVARVAQVALGVAAKINLGVIQPPTDNEISDDAAPAA